MTAGNNGASKPEDDDPFGYLYEDGRAAGAQPPGQGGQGGYGYPGPAAQPGVPRTSYNQVRTVGERQYGQVPPQQAYGQQAPPQYGQPNAQYAAPETYPGGAGSSQVPPHGGGRGAGPGRGGPNTKALLIAAVAVVAVVLIGIGAALMTGDDDKKDEAGTSAGPAGEVKESPKTEDSAKPSKEPVELPKQDAATLSLGGAAGLDNSVKGSKGANGMYVTGFNQVGSSVTWQADIKNAGSYRLEVRYAIPAKDANATLTVNGEKNGQPIGLKNFIKSSDADLAKNWQTTWAPVDLRKGSNEIRLSCEVGNQCDVILDWVEVTSASGS